MSNNEMRIKDAELEMIKGTFAGKDELLKVMRKIFLPEITSDAPIGQNIDLWMTLKVDEMTPEQALINIKARNSLIQHVEMCLSQIKILSGMKNESVAETKERLAKDSSK